MQSDWDSSRLINQSRQTVATQQLSSYLTSGGISMPEDDVSTAHIEASERGERITPRTAGLVLAKRPKAKKEVAIKHEYDADDSCDSLEL